MKLKTEHTEQLKAAILEYIGKSGGIAAMVEKYETGNFPRADKVNDLTTRFCWDMATEAEAVTPALLVEIYFYAGDKHVTTALKSFLPTLTKRY